MSYQIFIRDKSGTRVGEFTNWDDLSFNDRLNNYSACQFTVPHEEPILTQTSLRVHEVEIVRNGVLVWAGELADRLVTLQANSSNRVRLLAYSFFEMLNHRYSPAFVRFDATDQGQILKSLVDTSQAETDGDMGFTFGSVPATVDRDREYSNFNLMEAFINMSNLIDGVDFNVKMDKEIDIIPSKGIDISASVVFSWGHNIDALRVHDDFTHPANQAVVLGAGFGSSQARAVRTNTSARSVHKLRQKRVSEIDVSQTATLNAKGDEIIRRFKQPVLELEFRQMPNTIPNFGTIKTGDVVRIIADLSYKTVNNRFRIYEYDVTVGRTGEERIQYKVGLL